MIPRDTPAAGSGTGAGPTRVVVGAALFLTVFGPLIEVVACAADDPARSATAQQGSTPTSTATPPTPTITTRTTPLGTVLADAQGHTLYYLTTEADGQDQCTMQPGCSLMWPALTSASGGDPIAASGVTGIVGTISAADGTVEVTYDGWPLHTFGGEAPGLVDGEAQQSFGGTWYVATPALAPAPTLGAPSPPGQPGFPTPPGTEPTNPFLPTTPAGIPTPPALPTIPSSVALNSARLLDRSTRAGPCSVSVVSS